MRISRYENLLDKELEISLKQEVGTITHIFCYPVKSMAGHSRVRADLGWHGIEGDRRYAFHRLTDQSGFPWLSASRLPELLLYKPTGQAEADPQSPPTPPTPPTVHTPDGRELKLGCDELNEEVSQRLGSPVKLMQFRQGIFDESPLSVITHATIASIERESGVNLDLLRFRPNVVVDTGGDEAFVEENWIGKDLRFGLDDNGAAVRVTMPDLRCVMINFDPDTAASDPRVMKAAVKLNDNNAGVYTTVVNPGELSVGQKVFVTGD